MKFGKRSRTVEEGYSIYCVEIGELTFISEMRIANLVISTGTGNVHGHIYAGGIGIYSGLEKERWQETELPAGGSPDLYA